ncbi:MAG: glycosyltransferase WbuB [Planctomycetota bacterium]
MHDDPSVFAAGGEVGSLDRRRSDLRILLHGLNYAPEELGIGKYSGEMTTWLANRGHSIRVVTTPPYYPQWRIDAPYGGFRYVKERLSANNETQAEASAGQSIDIIRCPLWVPRKVTGLKRILHLASFGLSSIPVVFWQALIFRPDVILTVEPAAMCMPTTWLAARVSGATCWLHVQDFEVDAAFELGILRQPFLQKLVLAMEGFLMRRFDRVSSISPNMMRKAAQKGVDETRLVAFPNWVDCDFVYPIPDDATEGAEGLRERRRSFGLPAEKTIALYAGNIGKKQGLEIVLDAARRVPRVQFVICGAGADVESLKAEGSAIANVLWLSPQPNERFNDLLNCADMHLLPQRAGAADLVMPSKLTGMMASGRPVVACADPGTQIADVVLGRGLVVPAGDVEAFASSIARLSDSQPERREMGRAARRYAVKHLGLDSILSRFESDLQRLVGLTTG